MRELPAVWTKGALVRDKIPACKTTSLKIKCTKPPPKKLTALKKSILKQKLSEIERERQEIASRAQEEESEGTGKNEYDEKIAELGKKLESLQKDKHNMFLQLKQVLQREKNKQQKAALKKTQQEQPRYKLNYFFFYSFLLNWEKGALQMIHLMNQKGLLWQCHVELQVQHLVECTLQ